MLPNILYFYIAMALEGSGKVASQTSFERTVFLLALAQGYTIF